MRNKLRSLSLRVAPIAAAALPLSASATTYTSSSAATQQDPFATFAGTLVGWANSGLGVGIAVAAFLVGAGVGVAKNSALPMLGGVAIAAFLHWGPDILEQLAGNGAVLV